MDSNDILADDVQLKSYEATFESLIRSWVERFANKEHIYSSLLMLADRDREHFQYWESSKGTICDV